VLTDWLRWWPITRQVRPECYLCLYDKARSKPTFCTLLESCFPAESYSRALGCSDAERNLQVSIVPT